MQAINRFCPPSTRRLKSIRESGSAYVISLLALILLTIVGLSLTVVTQAELQIGANESQANRVFYAAESGISHSTARALTNADYASATFEVDEPYGNPLISPRYQVATSAFLPILDSPCNLCEINNVGSYADRAYRKVNHAVAVQGQRVAGGNDSPLAQKAISSMLEAQPWRISPPEALLVLDDPVELAKIRF
ncbi:MAG: pilus assembly PilX N-terminal domain-containing protein [Acidobacteriota bacterium]